MSNHLTREQKIQLLKNVLAGKKPQLPEPSTSMQWHFDGILFIELDDQPLKVPRPGGLQLNEDAFENYLIENPHLTTHVVFDTSGTMERGDLLLCELLKDDGTPLPDIIVFRVGATAPLGFMIPIKASQWLQYFGE